MNTDAQVIAPVPCAQGEIIGSSAGTTRPASLLLATVPVDTREFLPGEMAGEVRTFASKFHEVDPLSLDAGTFAELLFMMNPEVIVTGWKTPALPPVLPQRLKYVCHLTGSVRDLLTRRHIEDGLLVTNWGGSISRTVAEGALFHVLACLRRATHWALAMHCDGAWKTRADETASLFGRRVGIHGFGRVARELIALMAPFHPEISVHAPDVDAETERLYNVRGVSTLEALFEENDIIVELAPLNPLTQGIVDEGLLRLLRPGAVFVNTGRGKVVDERGLVKVASEGRVFFGLDVFALEPLDKNHPLRGLPNVTLTPHMSGPTTDRRRDAGAHALKNLRAYAAGQRPESIVTTELYDLSS